jgi:3-isopropylmalate dehydrogenase
MDTFANLRPCGFASEKLLEFSPLKTEVARGTNFMVIRELCGGVYFGNRKEDDGSGYAEDVMSYTRAEIERVVRLAATLCMGSEPPLPLFSLDKANVIATSRLWRKVVTELMEKEFPKVPVTHHLIDSAAMLMIKNPRALNGVIVTENMFGDIITDEASVIPGSLGLLPSASLTGIPQKGKGGANGIYEPIHGSAPDIAGKGIVNPIAAILSAGMLIKYSFGMEKEAQLIDDAVRNVLDSGLRTRDLGGNAGTVETGDAIAKELEKLLEK